MWTYYLLKCYALTVGAGLVVLGVLGATSLPPNPEHPEYVLHLGAGVLFLAGGGVLNERTYLRTFVGAMGALLVVGKVVIVGSRSVGVHFIFPGIGYVCVVVGVCSLLLALFLGKARGQ